MGCVRQAVLEFDEAVRAPWRPGLGADADWRSRRGARVRRTSSRVGVCPPVAGAVWPCDPGRRGVGRTVRPDRERVGPLRLASAGPERARAPLAPGAGGPGPLRLRLTRRARRLASCCVGVGVALGSWLGSLCRRCG